MAMGFDAAREQSRHVLADTTDLKIDTTRHEVGTDEDPNVALAKMLDGLVTLGRGESHCEAGGKRAENASAKPIHAMPHESKTYLLRGAVGVDRIHVDVLVDELVEELWTEEKHRQHAHAFKSSKQYGPCTRRAPPHLWRATWTAQKSAPGA